MTESDLTKLAPHVRKHKSAWKLVQWTALGLNALLWGLYAFVPSNGEMLGDALVGVLVAAILLAVVYRQGKALRQDLRTQQKEK